jgi:hypothetical protein
MPLALIAKYEEEVFLYQAMRIYWRGGIAPLFINFVFITTFTSARQLSVPEPAQSSPYSHIPHPENPS